MTSGKRARAIRQAEGQQRSAALRQLEARRRRVLIGGSLVVLLVLGSLGVGIGLSVSKTGSSTPDTGGTPQLKLASIASLGTLQPPGPLGAPGPEGVPIPNGPVLAGTGAAASGTTVDGIECQTSEQTLFHIHAHLTVFVDGSPRLIPYGIGIPGAQSESTPQGPFVGSGACFYWLHTHALDGIIHIESPIQRTYTLGDFFDIWGQPLSSHQVGPASGPVVALYDGKRYIGDPRNIPLHAHAQIQLDVGTPLLAPVSISFPNRL